MKKIITTISLLISGFAYTQSGSVGINTESPKSSLDVNGKKDINGSSLSTDITGLQAPRITRLELTNKGNILYGADQKGTLIYITDISGGDNASQRVNITSIGYYYFDGLVWIKVGSGVPVNITSDNGLTKTGNNIQLGGTLLKDTDIANAGFNTTFSGAGNIGIGINPSRKLDVFGTGRFSNSNSNIDIIPTTSAGAGINLFKNGTSNLSNPVIMGYINFGGRLSGIDNTVTSAIGSEYKGDGTNLLSQLVFRTSGNIDNKVVINEAGNLGVGINISPTEKIDVDGNVRVRNINTITGNGQTDKIVVADSNGVLKTVPKQTAVLFGGNLVDAFADTIVTAPANDSNAVGQVLKTITFTLDYTSLVTFDYCASYIINNISTLSDGKLRRISALMAFSSVPTGSPISTGVSFALQTNPVSFSNNSGNIPGFYYLNSAQTLRLTPGTYTVNLSGNSRNTIDSSVPFSITFGQSATDFINITAQPIQ